MTKRPDQHNLDQNEAGSTDYKFRRQTEEQNRTDNPDDLPANQAATQTPNEAMETRRQAAEAGRREEIERARQHTGNEDQQTDDQEDSDE